MEFDMPKGEASIIKVIGVGGGGSNAVNYMYKQGIKGVDFLICNTDQQALDVSPVAEKLQLGGTLTEGMGAGSIPDVGRNAAIESADDIKSIFNPETKMVFITAGMGGGTGTGAAPVIAQTAREMGILTVGIVTLPFVFEGRKRKEQAQKGIEDLRQAVDTLLIINNDKLRQMYGNLKMGEVFAQADNVLTIAAKGIAEIITRTGHINVDFQDVSTVMRNSGVAIMGAAVAEGEDRAVKAVEKALASPLLNDNDIKGARYILLNMEYGTEEITMDEIAEITDFIQEEAGSSADIIWGYGDNSDIGDGLSVTVIATGFELEVNKVADETTTASGIKVHTLGAEDKPNASTVAASPQVQPKIENPTTGLDPFMKTEESPEAQGKIEFTLDMSTESTPLDEPTQPELKKDALEPFVRKANETPAPQPRMDAPKPFVPKAITPTPPSTVRKPITPVSQPVVHQLPTEQGESNDDVSKEEYNQLVKSRMGNMRDMNRRLRTASGLSELEQMPAYQRRAITLEDVPHSSESQVSKYTLDDAGTDEEKKTQIGNNNSFLHDNVD